MSDYEKSITGIRAREGRTVDPVYSAVRDALVGSYDLLGDLGRSDTGVRVILARDVSNRELRVLRLSPASDKDGVDLEQLDALSRHLPANEIECPSCARKLRVWGRYCTRCGSDISGPESPTDPAERRALLAQIEGLAGENYLVLGSLPRLEGGGDVFFALDRRTEEIVTIALQVDATASQPGGKFTTRVTSVLRPLGRDPIASGSRDVNAGSASSRDRRPQEKASEAKGDLAEAVAAKLSTEYEVIGVIEQTTAGGRYFGKELATRRFVVLSADVAGPGRVTVKAERRFAPSETFLDRRVYDRLATALSAHFALVCRFGAGEGEEGRFVATRVSDGRIVVIAIAGSGLDVGDVDVVDLGGQPLSQGEDGGAAGRQFDAGPAEQAPRPTSRQSLRGVNSQPERSYRSEPPTDAKADSARSGGYVIVVVLAVCAILVILALL